MTVKINFLPALPCLAAVLALAVAGAAQSGRPMPPPGPGGNPPPAQQDMKSPGRDDFGPGRGRGFKGRRGPGLGPGGPEEGMRPDGMQRRRGGKGPGMAFIGLGLTDEQKTKIQGFMNSAKPAQAQREEMRSLAMAARAGLLTEAQRARMKALGDERKAKQENVRTQVLGVLTPEQKAKLEERRAMQMRRQGMRQRPQQMRRGRMDGRRPGRVDGPRRRQGPPRMREE